MPGPFDTTAKFLVQTYPRDWLELVGGEAPGEVTVVDADLSAVAAEADKVLRVQEPAPHLVHLEFQASPDANMGRRLARYNLLLRHQHDLPVLSVLIILRHQADGPGMRGQWNASTPTGQGRITFEYPVVRVWTEPVQRFLHGPLGLLPLAPLADVSLSSLPEVVRAMSRRIDTEAEPSEAQTLDVVTFTLMGLRYAPDLVRQLVPEVRHMRESSTYQLILDEGRAEGRAEGRVEGRAAEARSLLLLMGTTKFGAPDASTRVALEAITEIDRLERMGPRLLTASSWAELLSTP